MDIMSIFDWFASESMPSAEETNDLSKREMWTRLALMWAAAAKRNISDKHHRQHGRRLASVQRITRPCARFSSKSVEVRAAQFFARASDKCHRRPPTQRLSPPEDSTDNSRPGGLKQRGYRQ
jgi:hypothetical protein